MVMSDGKEGRSTLSSLSTIATSQPVLPDVAPRRQVLLQDPVASYLVGLNESTQGAVQRSLLRVASLIDAPSPKAIGHKLRD